MDHCVGFCVCILTYARQPLVLLTRWAAASDAHPPLSALGCLCTLVLTRAARSLAPRSDASHPPRTRAATPFRVDAPAHRRPASPQPMRCVYLPYIATYNYLLLAIATLDAARDSSPHSLSLVSSVTPVSNERHWYAEDRDDPHGIAGGNASRSRARHTQFSDTASTTPLIDADFDWLTISNEDREREDGPRNGNKRRRARDSRPAAGLPVSPSHGLVPLEPELAHPHPLESHPHGRKRAPPRTPRHTPSTAAVAAKACTLSTRSAPRTIWKSRCEYVALKFKLTGAAYCQLARACLVQGARARGTSTTSRNPAGGQSRF
ncbi:hypothetical protein C8R45DRAFT_1184780 [Mycena sanguinolenta]|nr:hypothetical protein C8R45DRAFT_1184780 [Mycena sanguinolenta]